MDWNGVAKIGGSVLLQNAPTIGSILGGLIPIPGGSMLGQQAGELLAKALGVDNTPEAVGNAIQTDPDAAAKIAVAENAASAMWPALAQMAQAKFQANSTEAESINATMRAELAAGQNWWAWRNLYGYSVAIEATATSWVILYALALNPALFKNVSDSFGFFMTWYGMRFGLLGYIHNQTTQEKVAAVTGEVPSTVAKVVKAFKGK